MASIVVAPAAKSISSCYVAQSIGMDGQVRMGVEQAWQLPADQGQARGGQGEEDGIPRYLPVP